MASERKCDAAARLRSVEARLRRRRLPEPFIQSALRATEEVLHSLAAGIEAADLPLERAEVRRFMEETGARPASDVHLSPVKETRRVERERTLALVQKLIREARTAHGRHEIKKTRSRLLKIDQRRLRREHGADGEALCREINAILRAQSQRL